jgi:hypothetical protein
VQLVRRLAEGCACFALVVRCSDMMLFFCSRVGKNRDPPAGGSPRREPWRAVAQTTKHSSLVTQLSRHGAVIAYIDQLAVGLILIPDCSL